MTSYSDQFSLFSEEVQTGTENVDVFSTWWEAQNPNVDEPDPADDDSEEINPSDKPGAFFYGTPYEDLLTGTDGNDAFLAREDNDVVMAGEGNDNVFGQLGNDTLSGEAGNDTIAGDQDDDSISGGDGQDYLDGGTGNDILTGDAGNDTVLGNDGQDNLSGGEGDDKLLGGADHDTLSGEAGNDTLKGSNGDDSLTGGDGDDSISGGSGRDLVIGGNGNDILFGNRNDDTLVSENGNDTLTGGSGRDTFKFLKSTLDIPGLTQTVTDFRVNKDYIDVTDFGYENPYPNGKDPNSGIYDSWKFEMMGEGAFFQVGDDTYIGSNPNLIGYDSGKPFGSAPFAEDGSPSSYIVLKNVNLDDLGEANFIFNASALID